ncbi:MAG: hypothetical protein R1F52_04495 [Candidatus Nitrosoabyssus spongiisocia]|nr:MAG: hypothetical protein R1F52_04495 [Nitrosopumilaceae archaeon AB1(1)]
MINGNSKKFVIMIDEGTLVMLDNAISFDFLLNFFLCSNNFEMKKARAGTVRINPDS